MRAGGGMQDGDTVHGEHPERPGQRAQRGRLQQQDRLHRRQHRQGLVSGPLQLVVAILGRTIHIIILGATATASHDAEQCEAFTAMMQMASHGQHCS